MENKYIYEVNGQSLNKDLLIASYGAFLSDVVSKIEDKDKTIAFFVVLQGRIGYRNLTGKIQVKVKDIQVIQDNIYTIFELKEDYYNELTIDNIIYSYTVFDVGVITMHDTVQDLVKSNKPFLGRIRIGKFSIPKTSNLKEWGQVHYIRNDKEALIFKYNSKGVYHVKFLSDRERLIQLKFKGKVQLTFTDTLLSEDPLHFKREYGCTTIYFKNGKVSFEVKKFFKRYIRPSKSRFYKCKIFYHVLPSASFRPRSRSTDSLPLIPDPASNLLPFPPIPLPIDNGAFPD